MRATGARTTPRAAPIRALTLTSPPAVCRRQGQPPLPKRGPLPKYADAKTRMARKLRSKKGSKLYAERKAIVETVNGQIKEARGLRRFLLRGLEKVNGEWHLIAAKQTCSSYSDSSGHSSSRWRQQRSEGQRFWS